jgi:cytochrome c biogenesis protein CcdA/thiol-disulfide isomerase/thioredoxin
MASPLLIAVGFLAGLLTIVSPCILPVLPAVIASGVTTGGRRRALAIAAGLAVAFGFTTLFSIRVLTALHLPLGLRYDLAIVVLFILAAGFIVPRLGEVLERPFARIGLRRSADSTRSGFVLGATLGLLYLPCGGPILGTISAVGNSSGSFGLPAVELTVAYSLGIALPVFGLVLLTERVSGTTSWLRSHAAAVRRTGGVLLLASALAITFGAATTLRTAVPSYTASIEGNLTKPGTAVGNDLERIGHPHETANQRDIQRATTRHVTPRTQPSIIPMADQVPMVSLKDLPVYGRAPDFDNVTKWINTPDGASVHLSQLRGKVVLIDFWTYSCINCLRSLPHVEAWYQRYHRYGLDVIGVHTPEFDFEHVASNVMAAVSKLGVTYPVAMDNAYGTWNAWANNSWPAEYLIDPHGKVRYGSIGETDYGITEGAIRALLKANGATLPPPTSVPNRTPMETTTPESYLGYERLTRYVGTPITRDHPATYEFASSLPASHLTYSGEWTVNDQNITAGHDAALRINVDAEDIYLVLSGSGTVTATFRGKPLATQRVSGLPELHTILSGQTIRHGVLQLSLSPGVTAYAFTFG